MGLVLRQLQKLFMVVNSTTMMKITLVLILLWWQVEIDILMISTPTSIPRSTGGYRHVVMGVCCFLLFSKLRPYQKYAQASTFHRCHCVHV